MSVCARICVRGAPRDADINLPARCKPAGTVGFIYFDPLPLHTLPLILGERCCRVTGFTRRLVPGGSAGCLGSLGKPGCSKENPGLMESVLYL